MDSFLEAPENEQLVKNCSVLVGMHPDEATDAIVDMALAYNKPFAIVPCCVFSKIFQHRKLPNNANAPVTTYEELIEYLKTKHKLIQSMFLPFDGRNLVLYYDPQQLDSEKPKNEIEPNVD